MVDRLVLDRLLEVDRLLRLALLSERWLEVAKDEQGNLEGLMMFGLWW